MPNVLKELRVAEEAIAGRAGQAAGIGRVWDKEGQGLLFGAQDLRSVPNQVPQHVGPVAPASTFVGPQKGQQGLPFNNLNYISKPDNSNSPFGILSKNSTVENMAGKLFKEDSGNRWQRGASTIANGAYKNFNSNIFARTAGMSVGAGILGGAVGAAGSYIFPNNIEYQGTVAPIFKGALMGAALGAAHGAGSRLMTKYPNNPMIQEFANKTVNFTNSKLITGAIGVAVAAGTTNVNLTNPINRVNGV